jgi:hypothetical protein
LRAGALVLALVGGGCQLLPVPEPAPADADQQLRLLGRNPWAARQRTPAGRRIHAVEYFEGQLYLGFGDWRANTGPIAVTSWDTEAEQWVYHYRAATEAIERFHSLQSGLLLPYTDPERSADFARAPQWQQERATAGHREAFAHVFAAAETDAGLFLAGTRRQTGEPLVQHWDGKAWHESLLLPGKADWIWFATVLDGRLLIQSEALGTFSFDGIQWQPTAPLFTHARTRAVVSVPGRVAGITRQQGPGYLQTSDGSDERTVEEQADAWDLNLDQATGWVYLLRSDRLERSRDLRIWQLVPVPVPVGASALDVAAGHAWIGTVDGSLWAVRLPEEPRIAESN